MCVFHIFLKTFHKFKVYLKNGNRTNSEGFS